VLCYTDGDFAEKVNELTNDKKLNIILDSIGGEITEQSIKCLAHFGRLVVFGNSSGKYGQLHAKDLHASCCSVLGYSLGTTRKERPEALQETASQVFPMLEDGQINIKISERFHLSEAAAAHQLVESRKSTGKVLLYTENQ